MDDDGWNRSLYVAWTVKIWQISDYKFERITTYSPIHITRDLFKDPNPRNYFCYRLFQMERNCDELQLIACDVKWTVIFRPWVSYLVQSILVQTSQISHFIISFFLDTKKPILFLCLDVASFVREVDESFSESQQMQMSHLQNWL